LLLLFWVLPFFEVIEDDEDDGVVSFLEKSMGSEMEMRIR
jgi:hypothetical protein